MILGYGKKDGNIHIATPKFSDSVKPSFCRNKIACMLANLNIPMLIAATCSAIASLLHVAIIFGGASWYRYFGAGERMARAAEAGKLYPTIVTMCIASMLAVWAVFGYSAAGVLMPLPLTGIAILLIAAFYLLRGLFVLPLWLFAPRRATRFWWWSSAICLFFGAMHVWGISRLMSTDI